MKKSLSLLLPFFTFVFCTASALAQSGGAESAQAAPSPLLGFFWFIVMVAVIVAGWKIFTKAGEPGWAILVPIYNLIVLLKIAGKPLWWIILMFIPFVNFVVAILVAIGLAKNFGKGTGFGIGLALLPFVFYPILGFGDATYVGSKSA